MRWVFDMPRKISQTLDSWRDWMTVHINIRNYILCMQMNSYKREMPRIRCCRRHSQADITARVVVISCGLDSQQVTRVCWTNGFKDTEKMFGSFPRDMAGVTLSYTWPEQWVLVIAMKNAKAAPHLASQSHTIGSIHFDSWEWGTSSSFPLEHAGFCRRTRAITNVGVSVVSFSYHISSVLL